VAFSPALLAFTNPTTNSYKRLVPGFEAPVNLAYSQGNRFLCNSAAVEESKTLRIPLSGCNGEPYLAFAAMLCAGIDGIKNEIDPGEPGCGYLRTQPEELAKVPSTPGSLMDALKP